MLIDFWYRSSLLGAALSPIGAVVKWAAAVRRGAYERGWLPVAKLPVPVVVVGNITVGGTGKTPTVIWLIAHLLSHGKRPAVLCRGYGGTARRWPQLVDPTSDPSLVGDEAVLLAKRAGVPVAAGPSRVAAARLVLAGPGCDVLVSDDGLQHRGLPRALEILTVDGDRGFGNGRCLPAGPLRESPMVAKHVDLTGVKGSLDADFARQALVTPFRNAVALGDPVRLAGGSALHSAPFSHFQGPVHAVCGIGNPEQFFRGLRGQGLEIIPHGFPDHHGFRAGDVEFPDEAPVLMTEKDALKCQAFATARHWYVPMAVHPEPAMVTRLDELLAQRGIL